MLARSEDDHSAPERVANAPMGGIQEHSAGDLALLFQKALRSLLTGS